MMQQVSFHYQPEEEEAESASNSYLMSLMAIIVGLPLPIVNLIATLIFYIANKKSAHFVRWHCTQALLSQLSLFFVNSVALWWTLGLVFQKLTISNYYFAYLSIVAIVNIIEFIATIYTTIKVRKGIHVEWWFYGALTHIICKPKK